MEDARRLVLDALAPLPVETVALAAAFGRTLAEPVRALDPAPPFDVSEMDGYAVRSVDVAAATEAAPAVLPVAFEIHAGGGPAGQALPAGAAAWIATGAPLPVGADGIIPREWTSPDAARRAVRVNRPAAGPGVYIRRRGEDYAPGEVVLAAGTPLTPGRVALAASAGAAALAVRRRPRVAILATGDELLEPGTPLRPGFIRESNRLLLAGLVAAAGGEPFDLGIVRDDLDETVRALDRALGYDLALTSGGASVGEHDFVRQALERLGAPPRFWRVNLKPGKPLAFAVRGAAAAFALPGNPNSARVTFHLFVAPAIRALAGRADVEPLALEATLEEDFEAAPDRRTYARARLRAGPVGALLVRPLPRQASGSVRSLAEANALLVLPEGARAAAGSRVRGEPLEWPSWPSST